MLRKSKQTIEILLELIDEAQVLTSRLHDEVRSWHDRCRKTFAWVNDNAVLPADEVPVALPHSGKNKTGTST